MRFIDFDTLPSYYDSDAYPALVEQIHAAITATRKQGATIRELKIALGKDKDAQGKQELETYLLDAIQDLEAAGRVQNIGGALAMRLIATTPPEPRKRETIPYRESISIRNDKPKWVELGVI